MRVTRLLLSLALVPGIPAGAQDLDVEIAAGTAVAQIVRGKSVEIRAFAQDLVIQSVEVTPAGGISVRQIGETTPDTGDRRQHRPGVKVWAITLVADSTAQLGERSFVIVALGKRSSPQQLRVVTHVPSIANLRILSGVSNGAVVRFVISVADEAQDVDLKPTDGRAFLFCSNMAGGIAFIAEKIQKTGAKTSDAYLVTDTWTGMTATGTCRLAVHIKDRGGIQSNTLEAAVTFK